MAHGRPSRKRRHKNKLKKIVNSKIKFYNAYSSLAVENDDVDDDYQDQIPQHKEIENPIPRNEKLEKPVPQTEKIEAPKHTTRHQRKAARRRHVKTHCVN